MGECYNCGEETGAEPPVCEVCALTNLVELVEGRGEEVTSWVTCPLCDGTGRCFFCSPGGPCYHCSGSGREMPGSEDECNACGGLGELSKGCAMCDFTWKCKHCGSTGKVPGLTLRR